MASILGVFAFAIIGLGVPVYCVLMRYNLRAGGLSEFWSHILAGAGPWAVSWLVYRGHGILEVLSWSGVIIDAVRCSKIALDRGIGGPLLAPSSYFMKSPPVQYRDTDAIANVEAFIGGADPTVEDLARYLTA